MHAAWLGLEKFLEGPKNTPFDGALNEARRRRSTDRVQERKRKWPENPRDRAREDMQKRRQRNKDCELREGQAAVCALSDSVNALGFFLPSSSELEKKKRRPSC